MKNLLKLTLLAVIVTACGCFSDKNTSAPIPVPTGVFSGTFTKLHKNISGHIDTAKATITLSTTTSGLFKLTGDTATVHAGSHGSFQLDAVYIQFQDSTLTVAKPTKTHLAGLYQYYYSGSVFQIAAANDTLSLFYDLKRN